MSATGSGADGLVLSIRGGEAVIQQMTQIVESYATAIVCREVPQVVAFLHDLRHTFASHAATNKEALPMIGGC